MSSRKELARAGKLPILLLLTGIGCYMPRSADPTTIGQGERLRIVLTSDGRARLAEFSDQTGAEVIGDLLRVTSDSLTISTALSAGATAGMPSRNLRQTLSFGRAEIQQVTVPQIHVGRTAAAVGSALFIAGLLILDVFDFGGSTSEGEPGGSSEPPFGPIPGP